ncbi:uncharacterized protein LOC109862381 [Pseudomyrmex gracilis]|uniref:uncharacterized protein LOC109862381 n=1 Tax=Pseudomyrmex gracilis TaxID=219809 RepID=UPI000995A0FA|nr:uncharacterized protein LOC109862381 [Pseudomyrmex gracilis]
MRRGQRQRIHIENRVVRGAKNAEEILIQSEALDMSHHSRPSVIVSTSPQNGNTNEDKIVKFTSTRVSSTLRREVPDLGRPAVPAISRSKLQTITRSEKICCRF